jgi:peptide/nickel transport system substrate-binding protein
MRRGIGAVLGAIVGAWLLLGPGAPARALDAVIAVRTETSAIDPHFALVGANQAVAQHIFDSLLDADENMRPVPGLAESFRLVEPTLWEFRLRAGAVFHDGSPVTAEDVRFSLARMPNVPNSPAPFVRLAGTVVEVIVVDERTVRLRTRSFDPAVPLHAMSAYVVSARAATNATTADFNSGRAAIGSGPYRFVEWVPGERLVLARNQHWWGPAQPFERVIVRPIGSDAARVAALLAGDVQLIDAVPPGEIARLRASPAVAIWGAGSSRMIYLGLEQEAEQVASITDAAGAPLPRNPLKDVRVRRAISLAINRAAIVERLLLGAGEPAGQMVPRGMVGFDPGIAPPPFDPDQARRLLAEAGYPQGFRITLTSPNDRYVEDSRTAQTVAQFLARVGIVTRVDVLPSNVFFTRAARREFPFFLIGFGTTTGDAYPGLSQVLATYDRDRGLGALNRMRFSDPRFDAALVAAQAQTDPAAREALLQRATRIAFVDDVALVPLHFLNNVWATRRGFRYAARADEDTLAMFLSPEPPR